MMKRWLPLLLALLIFAGCGSRAGEELPGGSSEEASAPSVPFYPDSFLFYSDGPDGPQARLGAGDAYLGWTVVSLEASPGTCNVCASFSGEVAMKGSITVDPVLETVLFEPDEDSRKLFPVPVGGELPEGFYIAITPLELQTDYGASGSLWTIPGKGPKDVLVFEGCDVVVSGFEILFGSYSPRNNPPYDVHLKSVSRTAS